MPEDIFRWVVAAGVILASVAFVVQAVVVLMLYSSTRKMQKKAEPLIGRVEPVIGKVEPMLDHMGRVLEALVPVIEKAKPVVEKAGPFLDKLPPIAEKAGQILTNVNQIVEEVRPKIAAVSDEAAVIVKSGREQVERIGDLLHDASDRARTRLEQIDNTVGNTVEQVEQAGESMRRAAMRPVKEVNGLAAGISAAFSTLMRGRKSSVDSATQDEEMFI